QRRRPGRVRLASRSRFRLPQRRQGVPAGVLLHHPERRRRAKDVRQRRVLDQAPDVTLVTLPIDARNRALCGRVRRHFEDGARRGLLVAFEGPDGAGKTTQRKLFKTWLVAEGYDVVTTKWNSSDLIKPIIKGRKAIRALSPVEFSLLHVADFRCRMDAVVLPA